MKYFSSDFHLGHTKIINFSDRPFKSLDEMNSTIIKNMTKRLKKGDIFYFLGDLSWSNEGYETFFNEIPKGVDFHWILGNHDLKEWKKYKDLSCITSISEMKHIKIGKTTVCLCHYPAITWNKSHYNSFQLFGHHHVNGHGSVVLSNRIQGKQLNVNCEHHNFKPWSEIEIVNYMEGQPDNWDYVKIEKE